MTRTDATTIATASDRSAASAAAICGTPAAAGVSRRDFLRGVAAVGALLAAMGLGAGKALAADGSGDQDGQAKGSSSADASAASDSKVEIEQGQLGQIRVAIVQLVDNDAFKTMIDGIKSGMEEAGYREGENAVFDLKNAQGDTGTLNSIAADLSNSDDYDVVMAIATPAAQACVNADLPQPVVFVSVTSPVAAGLMDDLGKPDRGATGTSNVIPVDQIFTLADKIVGGQVGTVGMLYCSGETNAVATVQKAKDYLDQEGRAYKEATVANSGEVAQAAAQLVGQVDMVYVPVDSTVQSAMAQLVEVADDAGVPVYGSDPVMVQSGALACVSVSNTEIGRASAALAVKITNGTPVEDLPCVTFDTFTPLLNRKTAETLGIDLPQDDSFVFLGE